MHNVTIKTGKIKDELFLIVEFTEMLPGHGKKDIKQSSTVPVHEDLKEAFNRLLPHLAVLCDELKVKGKDIHKWDDASLANYTVIGFTIGGSDDSEGVTLIGSKHNSYGIVNLNTPFTKFSADGYGYVDQLRSDIDLCIQEIEEYLFEGKRAPDAQLEMDFEAEKPTEV